MELNVLSPGRFRWLTSTQACVRSFNSFSLEIFFVPFLSCVFSKGPVLHLIAYGGLSCKVKMIVIKFASLEEDATKMCFFLNFVYFL